MTDAERDHLADSLTRLQAAFPTLTFWTDRGNRDEVHMSGRMDGAMFNDCRFPAR